MSETNAHPKVITVPPIPQLTAADQPELIQDGPPVAYRTMPPGPGAEDDTAQGPPETPRPEDK